MTDLDLDAIERVALDAKDAADECPDCDDNTWDMNDALDPTTVLALVALARKAEGLERALEDIIDWNLYPTRSYTPHEISMTNVSKARAALAATTQPDVKEAP